MSTPSAQMMKNLNTMIEPYGVPYFSENDCFPKFRNNTDMASVNNYFDHYKLNYNDISFENDQKRDIANHFWDDYRTFFGREYDRIICTNSFRRLQYKTQVMVNSASDEQRTRLLHSLEVQRIAKKIALGIGANADLAQNIAIAHDIGHAPFGHSGEDAINEYLANKIKNEEQANHDAHFLHAIQSVKVLDKIANHSYLQKYGINGLGLSDYVLEGVLKHDSDVFAEKIRSSYVNNQYDVTRLCGIVGIDNFNDHINKYLSNNSDPIYPEVLIGSIESQIVAWADKIAYLGHDWEEFLDTKLLEKLMSRINDMVRDIFKICKNEQQNSTFQDEFESLKSIKKELETIEMAYTSDNSDEDTSNDPGKDVWDKSVYNVLVEIIKDVSKIENIASGTHFFTSQEYKALKDYFAMVLSWVPLTNTYPKHYAMKCDPIYIFYMYLNSIRTTLITKAVTEQLIEGANQTLENCKNAIKAKYDSNYTPQRADYLGYCNSKWVSMYRTICNLIPEVERKKSLKNNVRNCYLVRFKTKNNDITLITIENYDYYNFDDTYCCLLNIIKCIGSQYIGSTRVNFMTQRAKKIVTELMNYYIGHPEMLPYSQRRRYKKNLTVHNDELSYFIADYVSGMTDRMAKKKYDEIVSSDTKWSNEYSSGLN